MTKMSIEHKSPFEIEFRDLTIPKRFSFKFDVYRDHLLRLPISRIRVNTI